MKKNPLKKQKIKCSCCRASVSTVYRKTLLKQLEELAKKKQIWWAPAEEEIIKDISHFKWACDPCLSSGRAILADPTKQKFCDSPPYLSYFDNERTCRTCGESFIFSASEQKFWYETLQFYVQSEAVNCLNCRRQIREKNGKSIKKL